MPASEKDVGRLEGQVDALTDRLDKLEPKLDELLGFMNSNKGAWKALTVVAGASSILGGVVAWMVEHGLRVLSK